MYFIIIFTAVDACSADKIGFNGGYNCSGDGESFSCALECPGGIEFEFPPASVYTCQYSEGTFEPQPIPQCVFASNMEVIPIGGSQHSFFEASNQSWSTQDIFGSISGGRNRKGSKFGSQYGFGEETNQVNKELFINFQSYLDCTRMLVSHDCTYS